MPSGSAEAGVPAVTVESGVQFSDLYPAAQQQPYPGDPQGPSPPPPIPPYFPVLEYFARACLCCLGAPVWVF